MAHHLERGLEHVSIEGQRWRQLTEQWSTLLSKRRGVFEERVERLGDVFHRPGVGDLLGDFDCKPKAVRNGLRPPRECRRLVPTVEGRIDLDAIEHRYISGEAASFLRKPVGHLFQDEPGGGGNDRQSSSPRLVNA